MRMEEKKDQRNKNHECCGQAKPCEQEHYAAECDAYELLSLLLETESAM